MSSGEPCTYERPSCLSAFFTRTASHSYQSAFIFGNNRIIYSVYFVHGMIYAASDWQDMPQGTIRMSTLQQRVKDILSDGPVTYAADDSETDVVNSIFDMLQKAETDLSEAQARVDNLKWKLAKAQEHQS